MRVDVYIILGWNGALFKLNSCLTLKKSNFSLHSAILSYTPPVNCTSLLNLPCHFKQAKAYNYKCSDPILGTAERLFSVSPFEGHLVLNSWVKGIKLCNSQRSLHSSFTSKMVPWWSWTSGELRQIAVSARDFVKNLF